MDAARSFSPGQGLEGNTGGVTMAGGFLLLTAFLGGSLFRDLGLPRLTGYLVTGMLAGPYVLDLVSEDMVVRLRLFNGIAISLIALTAGAEIELRAIRPLLRPIAWISLLAVPGAMLALGLTAWLAREWLPFLAGLAPLEAAGVAAMLGVAMAAQSPAVVVALRDELAAEGPVTRTVLGVVVLSDLLVILLFTVASSFARSQLAAADASIPLSEASLSWEIFGSLGVGAVIGLLIALYLRLIQAPAALTVVVLGFLVAELGERVHLDPLLIALAAGMLVRNATHYGERLLADIQSAAGTVYVVFFAVAGATVHLDVLPLLAAPIALFATVRATALLGGSALAARIAGAPAEVRRFAGFGLLPQAGLALAMALLVARAFPGIGPQASALIFGLVAVNELASPVAFRIALARSGEAGRRTRPAAPASSSGAASGSPALSTPATSPP
ncbi:MAG: cation:proton antiporter [Acidobacteria bacterium]|nr:cation:proton antiporter [Acidobacteriota bacterium]